MKNDIKLFAIFAITAFFFACTNQEALKPVSPNAAETQTYKGVGIVKKIDKENGKLTIDHEDIKGYMPAMEMTVAVKDAASLESLKEGDKISFDLERTGSKLLLLNIVKIGETAVIKGAEIYKTNCAECHGERGEGTKKGIPLISGHALHHSEAEHIKQVTDGEGEKMPAFKDKLTAEQIKAVVDHVRNELQKGTKREDSHKHKH